MMKTIGGVKEVLDTYNAKDWVKSADFKNSYDLKINNSGQKIIPPDTSTDGSRSFGEYLFESVNRVNHLQLQANEAIEKLATGQGQNLHETMLVVEQAELAFKTMNQIRMKVIDAYKEIMKMNI